MTNNASNNDISTTADTTYDPERSRIRVSQMERWTSAEVSGDLTEVPGIGQNSADALIQRGVKTTFQLFGRFLSYVDEEGMVPACHQFKAHLSKCETSKKD